MRYLLLILFSFLVFSGCQQASTQQTPSPDAKRYSMKGKVISVDKAKMKATIDHREIPGYMEAMTMDFPIKDRDVLETLTKDAEVSAELVVDNAKGEYWLENFAVTAPPDPANPALPDFKLTNQDAREISMNDFRGRALAITFIYSRCPLPEYCILMSKNFSDLTNQLQNDPELKDKIRLLSISFDPTTDTPETLKKYGLGYLGKDAKPDFTVWQLATGTDKEIRDVADFFGLRYETDANDKTQFNHSLRTIVISPDGKVRKVFAGGEWTTKELLQELRASF
jgi:protein SCO1/2